MNSRLEPAFRIHIKLSSVYISDPRKTKRLVSLKTLWFSLDCEFLDSRHSNISTKLQTRYDGTCCRACRSSRVCCAASRRLALAAEVSRSTRVCRSASSREEPNRNKTSSSTSNDCRRRRVWRHTSQSPSVKIKKTLILVVLS